MRRKYEAASLAFPLLLTFDEFHFLSIQDYDNLQVLIENTETSEEKLDMPNMYVDNSLTSTTIKH